MHLCLGERGVDLGVVINLPLALMSISEIIRRKGSTGDCGVRGILGVLGTGEIALCGIGRTIPELVYEQLGVDLSLIHI